MGRLVIVGCTNVGRYMIEEIMNNSDIKTELVGVVNLNSKVALNKANYDSYYDLQEKYNIEIKYCSNVNDEDVINWLSSKNVDLIIQTGWSQKFSSKLLSIPKYGCIGEHPAPLPKGRGAACVNWAILTGETEWGDTFFKMVEQYDKGCIYAQKFFKIEEYDNVFTVYEKVATTSSKIIQENVDKWSNGIFEIIEQDENLATYYKKRKPENGLITSFDIKAVELNDFIRAQTIPYPCAYIVFKGKKIKLLSSKVSNVFSWGDVGTIFTNQKNQGSINITCKDGSVIEIIRIQIEGKPSMWAYDWVIENDLLGKILVLD